MRIASIVAVATLALAARGAAAPDGRVLAYVASTANRAEIWTARADGTAARRVSPPAPPGTHGSGGHWPAWSPDGLRLAWTWSAGDTAVARSHVWISRPDGTARRRLTRGAADEVAPAWSPDGTSIAFVRQERTGGVVTVPAAGGPERLVVRSSHVVAVTWTPRGELAYTIVARAAAGRIATQVRVVAPTGGPSRTLLADGGVPAWSPDGARVAFSTTSDRFGQSCFSGQCQPNGEIYVARADGTARRRLTYDRANDGTPTWSADGGRIVFVSDRAGRASHDFDLWTIAPEGGRAERLLGRRSVAELQPSWRPG